VIRNLKLNEVFVLVFVEEVSVFTLFQLSCEMNAFNHLLATLVFNAVFLVGGHQGECLAAKNSTSEIS